MEIAQAFKEMTQQEVEQMGADLIEMQNIDKLNAVKDGVAFLGVTKPSGSLNDLAWA
jgi:hypothetical protein